MEALTILLPGKVWYDRYLSKNIGQTVYRLLLIECSFLVLCVSILQLTVEDTIMVRVISFLVYEIGYLVNDQCDFMDRRRVRVFFAGLFSRVILFSILIFFGPKINTITSFIFVFALIGFFIIHSVIERRNRAITYFALQCFVFTSPAMIFEISYSVEAILFFLPSALSLTMSYWTSKHLPSYRFVLQTSYAIVALCIFGFLIDPIAKFFLVGMICASITHILYAFRFELRKISSQNVIYHGHCFYSHDSQMSLRRYQKLNVSNTWITDHAEDYTAAKFNKMKRMLILRGMNFGLEFDIAGQHVVVLDPPCLVQLFKKGNQPAVLGQELKKNFKIWAHPHFAFRKLTRVTYITELTKILFSCEGVEVVNLKAIKRPRFAMQGLFFGLLAFLLGKKMILGHDFHNINEIQKYQAGVASLLRQNNFLFKLIF